MLSNCQIARKRDFDIIETLKDWKIMNTYQLKVKFFPSLRMTRKRMNILVKRKKVKQCREALDLPNNYYIDKYVDAEFYVKRNWLRIWLERQKAWGDSIINFEYDPIHAVIQNHIAKTEIDVYIVFSQDEAEKFRLNNVEFLNGVLCERVNRVIVINDQKFNSIVEGLLK